MMKGDIRNMDIDVKSVKSQSTKTPALQRLEKWKKSNNKTALLEGLDETIDILSKEGGDIDFDNVTNFQRFLEAINNDLKVVIAVRKEELIKQSKKWTQVLLGAIAQGIFPLSHEGTKFFVEINGEKQYLAHDFNSEEDNIYSTWYDSGLEFLYRALLFDKKWKVSDFKALEEKVTELYKSQSCYDRGDYKKFQEARDNGYIPTGYETSCLNHYVFDNSAMSYEDEYSKKTAAQLIALRGFCVDAFCLTYKGSESVRFINKVLKPLYERFGLDTNFSFTHNEEWVLNNQGRSGLIDDYTPEESREEDMSRM